MMIEITGLPIIGLKINRSIAMPSRTAKARVNSMAAKNGILHEVVIARLMYAPSKRNSPWAKFSTLVDLKMITNPIPTSA